MNLYGKIATFSMNSYTLYFFYFLVNCDFQARHQPFQLKTLKSLAIHRWYRESCTRLKTELRFSNLTTFHVNYDTSMSNLTIEWKENKAGHEASSVRSGNACCMTFINHRWPTDLPMDSQKKESQLLFFQQGRIHGYRSRVRVGRGHIWGHKII